MSNHQVRDSGSGDRDSLLPEEASLGAHRGTGGASAYSVTVAQLDALDRSLRMIAAHGDVLASVQAAELIPGTLPVIGQAIHDEARAMRDILDQVELRRRRVEDAGVGYGAPALRPVANVLVHPACARHEFRSPPSKRHSRNLDSRKKQEATCALPS